MYIVAGDQNIIGGVGLGSQYTNTVPAAASAPVRVKIGGIVHVIDEGDKTIGQPYTDYRARSDGDGAKAPSIICVIISSTTEDPANLTSGQQASTWKLWHYLVSLILASRCAGYISCDMDWFPKNMYLLPGTVSRIYL